jgi:hypothetical protein
LYLQGQERTCGLAKLAGCVRVLEAVGIKLCVLPPLSAAAAARVWEDTGLTVSSLTGRSLKAASGSHGGPARDLVANLKMASPSQAVQAASVDSLAAVASSSSTAAAAALLSPFLRRSTLSEDTGGVGGSRTVVEIGEHDASVTADSDDLSEAPDTGL